MTDPDITALVTEAQRLAFELHRCQSRIAELEREIEIARREAAAAKLLASEAHGLLEAERMGHARVG